MVKTKVINLVVKKLVDFYFLQAFGALSPLMTSSDLKLRFNDKLYETTCSFSKLARDTKDKRKAKLNLSWVNV